MLHAATAAVVLAALCAVALATPTGNEYCYISNHDDRIYVNNLCNRLPTLDGNCFMTAQDPPQTVEVPFSGRPINVVFTEPVPDLDEVTVVSCNASFGFNLTCTRQPLCVQLINLRYIGETFFFPPMVVNAPPRAVCALQSNNYNDVGHVVNNTVAFAESCPNPEIECPAPEIEFYTDLHCTPNAFIPGSGLQCEQLINSLAGLCV